MNYTYLLSDSDKARGINIERRNSGYFVAYINGRLVGTYESIFEALEAARSEKEVA